MERRELLKMIAALTGGAFIGGELLNSCKSGPVVGGATFGEADTAFLDEVAETILPATKTPGAKAANSFMKISSRPCVLLIIASATYLLSEYVFTTFCNKFSADSLSTDIKAPVTKAIKGAAMVSF